MIRHRFQVSITVEDDDQTDPEEFLAGHIEDILRIWFETEERNNGVNWPTALEVKHVLTHYSYTPKGPTPEESGLCCMAAHATAIPPWTCSCPCHSKKEEADGKCKDQAPTQK